MSKTAKATIDVQGTAVTVLNHSNDAYISLTDIAKHKSRIGRTMLSRTG